MIAAVAGLFAFSNLLERREAKCLSIVTEMKFTQTGLSIRFLIPNVAYADESSGTVHTHTYVVRKLGKPDFTSLILMAVFFILGGLWLWLVVPRKLNKKSKRRHRWTR